MKRFVAATLISTSLLGTISGCGKEADIGKDKATEIALSDAQLSESEVSRLRVSKDRDDGQNIYEVEFTCQTTEYEYEILASNGDILSTDYDESSLKDQNGQQAADGQQTQNGQQAIDGQQTQNEQPTQNEQNTTHNQEHPNHTQNNQANVQLSMEDASNLALKRVPGASAQDLKIELDYDDDGYYKYEGDIIFDQKEYEFEIDANTGDFLEWKEERR